MTVLSALSVMRHVEWTGNAFCSSHACKRNVTALVQVCQSASAKVLPPAAKAAGPVLSQPCWNEDRVTFECSCKSERANVELRSSDSLSKACRNNSWSPWVCRFALLAAAIAAEDGWYSPLALPPDPKATRGFPAAEFCFCGAIAPQKRLTASVTAPDSSPLPLSKQKNRVWSKQPVSKRFATSRSFHKHNVKVSV